MTLWNDFSKLLSHGIFIKFTEKEEYAEDLKKCIYMNTPHFYRKHEKNGIGDKREINDDYLIWCVTYINGCDIAFRWNNKYGTCIQFDGKIKKDIKKMINGDKKHNIDSMGKYMVIIFNPMEYIGNFISKFYSVNLVLDGESSYEIAPVQFGSVDYGKKAKYNKRLFKKNKVYKYQHEFRLVIDIYKDNHEDPGGFKTDFVDLEYNDIVILKCSDIIEDDGKILIPINIKSVIKERK